MTVPKQMTKVLEENNIEFVDLRFTDLRGKEHHVTLRRDKVGDELFQFGKPFDGSSIAGWRSISESDLTLVPEESGAYLDEFANYPTLVLRCSVIDPKTKKPYARDPRAVAKRLESHLISTGIADKSYFGQEVEFFVFDDVRFDVSPKQVFYSIDSEEADWNKSGEDDTFNHGHRPRVKGGYFPVPPVDSLQALRNSMSIALDHAGLKTEVHHHEVASAGQCEIITRFNTLLNKADEMQVFKYIIQNVAHDHGKTVTFMPKPLMGDNGSGLHCHQSLSLNGKNIFSGDLYSGLSQTALYYIGGILKHARALNALTNPSTNSYKRLVPGFEAPVIAVYSAANRSAAIRVPHAFSEKESRIEVRFPDAMANPYLAFSALVMAGLDGIQNQIHPGDASDFDLYHLSLDEKLKLPNLCGSLEEALNALEQDHQFLLSGGVFNEDLIQAYIQLKREEIQRFNTTTHPVEFDMYFSL